MKKPIVTVFLSALLLASVAESDCLNDSHGNVVCGKGECRFDQTGKAFCAPAGGGAAQDEFLNVYCGIGYCAKDSSGKIWCSKEPGGDAATDSNGKVKCMGGCEAGSRNLCQEAK